MMFTRRQRRGIGIVATCAAVTMAVSLASPAFAGTTSADGQDAIVLTPEQVDELATRGQADVYRDGGVVTDPADPAGSTDEATDGGGNHLDATAPTWKQTVRAAVEGTYGMVQTVPLAGAGDDYLAIDALGTLQRRTATGGEVWRRDNSSWYAEWGVKPARPWQIEPYPIRIAVGYNAVSPISPTTESGFATGDLTGDGVADLAFTAEVGTNPYRPMQGSPSTGTFVTIVDGADGHTLWSKLYPAVYSLDLVDGTLVIADSPSVNINSPAGSPMALRGLRFATNGSRLDVASTWTYDPGAPKASSWSDLEPIGNGLLAASWNRRKETLATVTSGHTLVIDTKDGSVKWTASDRLYARQLRWDASRNRIVGLEQSDPNDGVQYAVTAYAAADGARSVLDTRINAFALDAAIGDLGDGGAAEVVVSEATMDPSRLFNASSIRALDGRTGAPRWSRTLKRADGNGRDGILGWGVAIAGGRVVVNYRDDAGFDTAANSSATYAGRISVLAGNNGSVKWEHTGAAASQIWSQILIDGKDIRVRTVDTLENVRTYNLGSGKQTDVLPLAADSSTGVTQDITGDGADDLIVGGNSSGLFAYDGRALMSGQRVPLWTAVLPGAVIDAVRADVTGDGVDEIVVAADTATVVVDARTGKVLRTIDGGGQFVRTVGATDVDGDGKAEIVVATDAVRVYRADGKPVWQYQPAAGVVVSDVSFGDGKVYAEYATRSSLDLPSTSLTLGAVALDAATGKVAWQATPTVDPALGLDGTVYGATLHAATFASPEIPYADGHAVVYTWLSRPTPTLPPAMFMEIRDGRTGEVLHSARLGGPHNLGGWAAGPEGLLAFTTGAVTVFGPNGADIATHTVSPVQDGGFVAGPHGERILVTGSEGGVSSYPMSLVVNPDSAFISAAASTSMMAGREIVFGDLDGDGRDEAVSLNFDLRTVDRTAELFGSQVSTPFTAMRKFAVISFDPV